MKPELFEKSSDTVAKEFELPDISYVFGDEGVAHPGECPAGVEVCAAYHGEWVAGPEI